MNKTRIFYSIIVLIVFFAFLSDSCRKAPEQGESDIIANIPENASFFIKLNRIYQYNLELFGNEESFKKITGNIFQLIIDQIGPMENENDTENAGLRIAHDFFSFFDEDVFIDLLKEQIVTGIIPDKDHVLNPFVIAKYSNKNNKRFSDLYENLSSFFKKHSSSYTDKKHNSTKYSVCSLNFLNNESNKNKVFDKELFLSNTGNSIIISLRQEDLINIIDLVENQPGSKNILNNETYKVFQRKSVIFPDSPVSYFYSHYPLIKSADLKQDRGTDDPGYISFLDDISSLIKGYSMSLSRDTKTINMKGYVLLNSSIKDKNLLSIAKIRPSRFNFLNFTPQDSIMVLGMQFFDIQEIYDYIVDKSPLSSELKDLVVQNIETADPKTGFTIKDDIIDIFGPEIGFSLLTYGYGNLGFLGTEFAVFIEHNDLLKATQSLERFKNFTEPMQPFKSYDETYGNYTFTVYPLGILSPSLLLLEDFLIVGSTRLAIKKVIDTIGDKKKNIYNDKLFIRNIKELGMNKEANIIHISKTNDMLNNFVQSLQTLCHITDKAHINAFEKNMFQLSIDIIKYINIFNSTGTKCTLDNDGYLIESMILKID